MGEKEGSENEPVSYFNLGTVAGAAVLVACAAMLNKHCDTSDGKSEDESEEIEAFDDTPYTDCTRERKKMAEGDKSMTNTSGCLDQYGYTPTLCLDDKLGLHFDPETFKIIGSERQVRELENVLTVLRANIENCFKEKTGTDVEIEESLHNGEAITKGYRVTASCPERSPFKSCIYFDNMTTYFSTDGGPWIQRGVDCFFDGMGKLGISYDYNTYNGGKSETEDYSMFQQTSQRTEVHYGTRKSREIETGVEAETEKDMAFLVEIEAKLCNDSFGPHNKTTPEVETAFVAVLFESLEETKASMQGDTATIYFDED